MNRTGFTLIELLVVVLIIGILAAIAMPIYQTSVDKTHFTGLMPLSKSIKEAEEAFFLTSGEYTGDLSALDIAVPDTTETYNITLDAGQKSVRANNPAIASTYVMYFNKSENFPGDIHCEAPVDDTRANKVCVSAGGAQIGSSAGDNIYLLSGKGQGDISIGGCLTNPNQCDCNNQCSPGQTDSQPCPSPQLGTQIRTCSSACQWGSWDASGCHIGVVGPPVVMVCTPNAPCGTCGLCRADGTYCQEAPNNYPFTDCANIGDFCGGTAQASFKCNGAGGWDFLGWNTSQCTPCSQPVTP